MRYVRVFVVLNILAACLLNTSGHGTDANIVTIQNQSLTRGCNEVVVNCEAMSELPAFSTLDQVVQFFPAEGVLGDELEFALDGFRQRYRFTEYCGTNSSYRLVRTGNNTFLPETISLDAIPLPEKFWVNHAGTNKVQVCTHGELSEKYRRAACSHGGPNKGTSALEVRVVPPNGHGQSFILSGGMIRDRE